MASEIVEGRHEAQRGRALKDREQATASAAKKQTMARTAAGLTGKGNALAMQGLNKNQRKQSGVASAGSAIKGEEVTVGVDDDEDEEEEGEEVEEEEENEEEEEEEEEKNSILLGGKDDSGARGLKLRKKLAAEGAALQADIEKRVKVDEEAKRRNDPLWQVLGMLKEDKGGGGGGGGGDPVYKLLERMEKKDQKEAEEKNERERLEKETREDEEVMKLSTYMQNNNLTPSRLPPRLKRKWDKLNADSDNADSDDE